MTFMRTQTVLRHRCQGQDQPSAFTQATSRTYAPPPHLNAVVAVVGDVDVAVVDGDAEGLEQLARPAPRRTELTQEAARRLVEHLLSVNVITTVS
jgi:hypothetical protein